MPDRGLAPRRRAFGLAVLGLVGLLALAHGRVLLGGETFAMRDHLSWTLPSRAFLGASLRDGHLPEWWDGLRLGDRFAADPNNGVTYPPAWLVALGDPLFGADVILLLHMLLMGVGAWLLARRLGASALGAWFGAGALMLSGYVASMPVNGSVLMPMGWMPLSAWAALGVAQAEERAVFLRRGLGLAAVIAGSVAAGNPTGVYNLLLAGALVLLAGRRRLVALATFGAAGGLGTLMGAASVLAPLATLADSARASGFSLQEGGTWSMHPLRLLELAWPDLLGHGLRPQLNLSTLWVEAARLEGSWSASDYVGLPVLVCAGLAAVGGGGLLRRLGLLSLGFVVLALGTHTPIYGAFRALFRFEQVLRYPEKHLCAGLVLWSALAAVGFDRLFEGTRPRRGLLFAGCVVTALLGLATLAGHAARARLVDGVVAAAQARGTVLDAAGAIAEVLAGGLMATTAAGLVVLAIALRAHGRWGRFVPAGFAGLALAQLVAHAMSVQVLLPRAVVREPPASLASLMPPTAGPAPRLVRRARESSPVTVPAEIHALHLHHLARDNAATRFGFGQVPGYAIAGTPRFDAFAAASGRGSLERVMDLLDVRYLLITAGGAPAMGMPVRSPEPIAGHVVVENPVRRSRAFVAYRFRHGMSDQAVLAELFRPDVPADLGRVYLAGGGADQDAADAPTPCRIERSIPEHVVLQCRASRAGYAVLVDEWTRGWTASVDGVAAPIERADVILRAVALPAGEHRVEMRYRTPGLRLGAVLAATGWAIFLALALLVPRLRIFGSGSRPESRPPRSAPPA